MTTGKPNAWQESQPAIAIRSLSPSMVDDLPIMTSISVGTGTPVPDLSSLAAPASKKTSHGSRRRRSTVSGMEQDIDVFQAGSRLIDRYEVLRKIGQGGMSLVYEAFDEVRDEHVALKVLLPSLAKSPRLQQRFLQEGRVSSSFSHPHIARVYDLHETTDVVMISMELLSGSNLRHDMERRLGQRQSYRPQEVLSIIEQVAEALEVVHNSGIIHRDLKPENLWLGLDETVKIMDFGIARESVGAIFTTGPRGSGTPYYIAPEQLSASPSLDHRADQYSLAVIAYEMLTGEIPQGAIVPPHVKVSSVPRKLSKAIYQALSSDPNKRFADVRSFSKAARFRTGLPRWARVLMLMGGMVGIGGAAAGFHSGIMPMLQSKDSPVWANVARQSVKEKETIKIECRDSASTLTSQQLVFRLMSDAPDGCTIDPSSGMITWTPTEAQGPKDYKFQVMAVINQIGKPQAVEEKTIEVAVTEAIDSPTIETPVPGVAREHEPYEYMLVGADQNAPQIGLRYELVSGPAGLAVDSQSGKVTWKPTEADGGTNPTVEVKLALDHEAHRNVAVTCKWSIRVEESIDAPEFTSPKLMKAKVDKDINFRVTARDPNVPAINLYYKLRNADSLGMSIDPQSGELTWTPDKEQSEKEFDLVVEAYYDGAGESKKIGEQVIKVAVAKYIEPKKPEPIVVEPPKKEVEAKSPELPPETPPAAPITPAPPAPAPLPIPAPLPEPMPAPVPAPAPCPKENNDPIVVPPSPVPHEPTPAPETCPNKPEAPCPNQPNGTCPDKVNGADNASPSKPIISLPLNDGRVLIVNPDGTLSNQPNPNNTGRRVPPTAPNDNAPPRPHRNQNPTGNVIPVIPFDSTPRVPQPSPGQVIPVIPFDAPPRIPSKGKTRTSGNSSMNQRSNSGFTPDQVQRLEEVADHIFRQLSGN